MSQDLTRLATTAIDEFSSVVRLQTLIEICASHVHAEPSRSLETMQEKVGLLRGGYLSQALELQNDQKLTRKAIWQQAARLSEFEGVRHGK